MIQQFSLIQQQLLPYQMPSATQFLQNPQLFPYQSTLSQNPDILHTLIDYISKNPDPLLQNQQQCYTYPNKSAQILSLGTTYRALIVKVQQKNKKTNELQSTYPYLDILFKNIQKQQKLEQTLLGYINKVLISLAKKTPQIYQYFKDHQSIINYIVKNNLYLRNLKEFFVVFLIQSTMGLYVFLKNVLLRALMFRIIDQKDTDNIYVYETLFAIYLEIAKKMKSKILPQDEKEELQAISVNFHDFDFITLLTLKISSQTPERTLLIGKLLNQMAMLPGHNLFTQLTISHMQALEQYFQTHEQSSNFMTYLPPSQLQILSFLSTLSSLNILEPEYQANLLKRLLVYSGIHSKNSILHNLLFKVIQTITKQNRCQIFQHVSVVPFLIKNWEDGKGKGGDRFGFGGLVWRVCGFWEANEKVLGKYLNEEEKGFVKERVDEKRRKFENLTMYKAPQQKEQLPTETEESLEILPMQSQIQQKKQTEEPQKSAQQI